MRNAFFSELTGLFRRDSRVVFITGDLGYKLFDPLLEIDPKRVVNFGIREPSMIGYAAGLSKVGLVPFVYSIAPFLVLRCLEQIKLDLCYNKCSVVLVGVGGGLTYGPNGPSHHGPDDIGALSCLPGMRVLTPGDPDEVRACVRAVEKSDGPVYLRLGRNKEPNLNSSHSEALNINQLRILSNGPDGTIISCGPISNNVLIAKNILESAGIRPTIIHVATLRPFPSESVMDKIKNARPVMTVEEHVPAGGLGHQVAHLIAAHSLGNLFGMLSIPDRFPSTCLNHTAALGWAGLDPETIAGKFARLHKKRVSTQNDSKVSREQNDG